MSAGWDAYFGTVTPDSVLYQHQAAVYVDALSATVGLRRDQRILDFGCGFGYATALLAARAGEVWWWEPSSNMRSVARRQLAGSPNARFCDLTGLPFSNGIPGDLHSSFDSILVNSVAQYMSEDELWAWLPWWRRLLAPAGRVVLSDLISRDHRGVSDILDLLRLGTRYGSPFRAASGALGGAARYWRIRRAAPLTRIGPAELAGRAAAAGFDTEPIAANLTHFRARWSAILRPRPSSGTVCGEEVETRRQPSAGGE